MNITKLAIYLSDLSIRAAPKKQKGAEDSKILVAACVVQPFTSEIAEALVPSCKSKLFGRDGNPAEDMKRVTLSMHAPYYFAGHFFRVADNVRPQVKVEDVKLEPTLEVRRDKETPVFAATFRLDFPFPAEDDARDLMWLARAVNSQLWISLVEQQGNLVDKAEEPAGEPEGE